MATTYVSSTKLTATIPASDFTAAQDHSITVVTPAPGGGTSNALTFHVTAQLFYQAPSTGANSLILRKDGAKLEILDNGVVVAFQALDLTSSVKIVGGDGVANSLKIDISGGVFSTPVTYTGSTADKDTLVGPDATSTWHITGVNVKPIRCVLSS